MNYIYDITLNFNKKLYNFYEWKFEDYPEFILKIPIIKVNELTFYDIKNNNIKINNNILNFIKNQTEIYRPNAVKIKKYASLFACEDEVIAIEFDENGYSVYKSTLSLDEENDILEMINVLKNKFIDYKICSKEKSNKNYKTRKENEMIDRLENELKNLMTLKDYDKLKYIFYEIYNKKINDYNKIYIKLLNVIKKCDDRIYLLDELINIINNKKIYN